jgi:tRNA dimethylallyltransferase
LAAADPERGPTLIVIGGPTASGKSGLAMRLARSRPIEIISADSAQVYRGLDVGTAKPSVADRQAVPHHLVDVCGLDGTFDAGHFADAARQIIADVHTRAATPVVVGGTGLYIRALLYGLVELPPRDDALRTELRAEELQRGSGTLHARLREIDPESAASIHENDEVRTIRALEVFQLTGRRMSDVQREHDIARRTPAYEATQIAVCPARDVLYERIDRRVDAMFDLGWLEEVRGLLAGGANPECRPLATLGYRHLVDHLLGRHTAPTLEDAVRLIKRDHRRYAKRQLTWFRAQPGFVWVPDADAGLAALGITGG